MTKIIRTICPLRECEWQSDMKEIQGGPYQGSADDLKDKAIITLLQGDLKRHLASSHKLEDLIDHLGRSREWMREWKQ